MRDFKYYLKKGDVRKVSPDYSLAKALLKNLLNRGKKVIELNVNKYSSLIFENLYDCFREAGDSLLSLNGYKSYSHQATIVYFKNYNFSEEFINRLDNFRYKRNSSKYYGEEISTGETLEIIKFYKKYVDKIRKYIEEELDE